MLRDMTARPSTTAHVVVGAVLAVTGVGAALADGVVPATAAQHLRNPAWPPHAKFHDAQYVVMSALLGAGGLRLLTLRSGDPRTHLRQAAAVASVPWLGMWAALLVPGTAASDPEFAATEATPLGLHPQLLLATVMLGGLTAAVGTDEVRARRGRRRPLASVRRS